MAGDDLSGRRLGGFELIELLGEGSYGSVWRARQTRLDRDVAVKVLDPLVARDPNAARRFEREGRAAASLEHSAIVPVYEAGDEDGLYFLAMRLVDGETLADVITREAPLIEERVVDLVGPIAAALDAAHAAGLIHRDVKPANILIEAGRPYLADFGIAASARELGRYTTGSIGTAEYMAPEQARGEEVDHRSDLYALGCVAFHALTGESPFRRDDMVSTLMAHTSDPIPLIGDQRLDAFFSKALAKERDERFDSGAEFIAVLSGESPTAPTVLVASANRPKRRGLLAAVAASVAVVLGVAAFAVLGGGDDDQGDAAPATTIAGVEDTVEDTVDTTEPAVVAPAVDPSESVTTVAAVEAPNLEIEIRNGGIVQVGTTLDLSDPNPHSSLDTARVVSEWVLPVMYRIDSDLNPVPSLATGPPIADTDDPLSLTWTINADQLWNDGTAVTAADVAATFGYLTADGTNAASTLLYDSVDSVEALDATTLRLQMNEPNGAAYLMFSTVHPIIQSAAWTTHLDEGGASSDFLDAGWTFAAGPYQLATRQNPGEVSLVPNPEWVGEQSPTLERVQIATYEDSAALVLARSRQELDVIWVKDVDERDVANAREIDDTDLQIGSSNIAVQLSFNHQNAVLNDSNVRGAIALAIDRVSLADQAVGRRTGEVAQAWDSLVFAPAQAGNSSPFADQFDVDTANELLDTTAWQWPDPQFFRRDFSTNADLGFELVYVNNTEFQNAALNLVQDLQKIGMNVVGIPLSAGEVTERFESGEFDLLLQFRVFNNDPVATDLVFGTAGCPVGVPNCSGNGVNFGAFTDPVVDQLLADADSTTDLAQRLGVYGDVDRALATAFAAVPLYVRPAFTAYDTSIVGIEMAPNIGPLTSLAAWGILDS